MKKIILKESQVGQIIKQVLNEQDSNVQSQENPTLYDGRYNVDVVCDFNFYKNGVGITYKGREIEDIHNASINVSYLIDIIDAPFGIKGIRIHDIKGPSEVKAIIECYPQDTDPNDYDVDLIQEEITLPINWRKITVDKIGRFREIGYFGVDNRMDINLEPDGQGGLRIRNIDVSVSDFTIEED